MMHTWETALLIGLASIVFGAQVTGTKRIFSYAVFGYGIAVGGAFLLRAYWTWQQYSVWSGNEFGKLFLPPNQSISYFLSYIWTNIWLAYTLTLCLSVIVLAVLYIGNKWFQGRFFHNEEQFLAAIGILIVGYMYAAAYIAAVLAVGVLWSLITLLFFGKRRRLSLRYLWLPIGIVFVVL